MKNNKEYIIAKEKAIKYIGIAKKTEYEVIKKLKGLKVDPLVISAVIEDLNELGYLDDIDYVKSYLIQSDRFLQYSKYEIKQKLLQKGLNISIIEEGIEEILPENYEEKVKDKLLSTKLKSYEEDKKKAYLYRRGFNTNIF